MAQSLILKPRYRERGVAGVIRTIVRGLADLTNAYRVMPNMVELSDGSVWLKILDAYGAPDTKIVLPDFNEFLDGDDTREVRSETAMEMMDPDVYGYMLFLLKQTEVGPELAFRTQIKAHWVSAFTSGFARIIEGIEGMGMERPNR